MPNVLLTRKINDLNFTPGRDALLFIKMRRVIYKTAIINFRNIIKSLLEQPTHLLFSC